MSESSSTRDGSGGSSRRDFLKLAATAAAGTVVANHTTEVASATEREALTEVRRPIVLLERDDGSQAGDEAYDGSGIRYCLPERLQRFPSTSER